MTFTEQMVLSEIRRLTRRELRQWVRRGRVKPAIGRNGPHFDEIDIARLRLICDLRKDMGLPPGAVPVVLGLMDQLHRSRRDLHLLLAALAEQPGDVRAAISRSLQARARLDPGKNAGTVRPATRAEMPRN